MKFYDVGSESVRTSSMPREFFLRVDYLREEKASQNRNLSPTERKTARESMMDFNKQLQAIGAIPFDTDGEINISNPSSESTTSSVDLNQSSIIADETRCKKWLITIMRDKNGKIIKPDSNKKSYFLEAKKKFSNLTCRGFDRAWSNAIEETSNTFFSQPGRKS
ncbi:hypothetical protein [Candidatus Magnetaquiglobus chichijimensis]|uniref:hypothetical protein n=1 Tax=Candidatus Magnetaquiglobus chichijimensis TaxID=3141448 RepID=UPI003B97B18F